MRRIVFAVLLASGCSPSETSIVLSFPSAAARAATKEVGIFAFPRDESAATATCREFLAHLPKGEQLGINAVDDLFELNKERTISNFPAGNPVVMVVGYNATEPDQQKPILQGCSDTYGGDAGYTEVPVELSVVIPAKTSLNKIAGDHQVGRVGEELGVPLKILVDTAFDMATQRDRYALPAVPVHIEVTGAMGVSLSGGAAGTALDLESDANGLIEVRVQMPDRPATATIKVTSPDIQAACEASLPSRENKSACKAPSERSFVVSTVDASDVELSQTAVIDIAASDRVVGVGVGDVTGDSAADAVVLSCRGSVDGCRPGRQAKVPLGQTQLTVISDVIGAKTRVNTMGDVDLGVAPGGLFVGPLIPGGHDEIALVNSRRKACQPRCENSETLVLSGETSELKLEARTVLSASNAVALAGVRRDESKPYGPLVTASQGSAVAGRACSRASMCLYESRHECSSGPSPAECQAMCNDSATRTRVGAGFCVEDMQNPGSYTCPRTLDPILCAKACTYAGPVPGTFCHDVCAEHPEQCGCPANQRCECTDEDGCPEPNDPGHCVNQDKFVDRLSNAWAEERPIAGCTVDSQNVCFENRGGCHNASLYCVKGGDAMSVPVCACNDGLGNECTAQDACGCKVPVQISIGDQAGVVAHDVAIGTLTTLPGSDLLAASEGGVDFFTRQAGSFKWSIRKTPTAKVHFVKTVRLDDDAVEDIVWLSKQACDMVQTTSDPCPLARPAVMNMIDGAPPRGCMGVYVREFDNKVDTVRDDGCRRYLLPFEPAGVCIGDVNGDLSDDVIVSSLAEDKVFAYLSDGSGGLLDPPLALALPPAGKGGPVTCADVDGDQRTDLLVAGPSGKLSVLRSGL